MADINHSERAHATWSASATARNINCSGALAFIATLPPEMRNKESEAAAWGTACHELAENCLRLGTDAGERIDEVIVAKGHKFDVDEEMADTAQIYVNYVRGRIEEYIEFVSVRKLANSAEAFAATEAKVWYEQNFSLAALSPPFDAGGTADAVMWFPVWKLLEVVDLKGGRGVVVEVKNNGQARTYSIGAVLCHPDVKPSQVMSTIVQPRASHPDGRIRSETLNLMDLMWWTSDLKESMHKSKLAQDGLLAAQRADVEYTMSDWKQQFLNAGDHCQFCPAAGVCPALEQKAKDKIGLWFDDMDQPRLANAPGELSNERLAEVLDAAEMITSWLKAVASEATYRLETNQTVGEYALYKKEGRRAWISEDKAYLENEISARTGLHPEKIYQPAKLSSPAQIEKLGGVKAKAAIADLWEKPDRGVAIGRADKATRKPAQSTVDKFFSQEAS